MDKVKSLIESIEKQKIKVLQEKSSGNNVGWKTAKWVLDKLERDLKKLKKK